MKKDEATRKALAATVAASELNDGLCGWIPIEAQKPNMNEEVLVVDGNGARRIATYVGHNTFSVQGYPVLGQEKVSHWVRMPDVPAT